MAGPITTADRVNIAAKMTKAIAGARQVPKRRRSRIRNGIDTTGAIAVVSGLAPHVLHDAGLLIGVALFSGAFGTSIFGVLGFAVASNSDRRQRRRFSPKAACLPVSLPG